MPFYFARYTGGADAFLGYVARLPLLHIVVLTLLTIFYYFLDYVRFYSLPRLFGHRLSWQSGVRLTTVSYFVTSLTPNAELHAPAMIFLLTLEGVPLGIATAATIAKSLIMTLWVLVVAFVTAGISGGIVLPHDLGRYLPYYLAPLAAFAIFLALIIFYPRQIQAWIQKKNLSATMGGWKAQLLSVFGQCSLAIATIGRSKSPLHLLCHAASVVFIFVYAAIGYVLCLGTDFAITAFKALTVFSNGLMVAYVAPVPGSIGVTEFFTAYLMDPSLGQHAMAVSLMLRTLCWYLALGPGAILLVLALRQWRWLKARRQE